MLTAVCRFGVPTCDGRCNESHYHGLVIDEDSLDDSTSPESIVSPPPVALRSPGAIRDLMRANFIDTVFPAGSQTGISQREFFITIAPKGPIMMAAIDALLLAQQGVISSDARLLFEGQRRHQRAIAMVAESMSNVYAAYSDELLAAVTLLGICELHPRLMHPDESWRCYVDGLSLFMRARGPLDPRFTSGLARSVLHGVRHVVALDGLMNGSSPFFTEPGWLEMSDSLFTGHQHQLSNLAMELPALINLIKAKTQLKDNAGRMEVLAKFSKLEAQMKEWLLQWYLDTELRMPSYISISHCEKFVAEMGLITYTFPQAIVHVSLEAAMQHNYFWVCLLSLRSAMLDFVDSSGVLKGLPSTFNRNRLIEGADECAKSICQTASYLFEQHSDTFGGCLAAYGPLRFVHPWFTKRQDRSKLAWLKAVEDLMKSGYCGFYMQRESVRTRSYAGWLAFS